MQSEIPKLYTAVSTKVELILHYFNISFLFKRYSPRKDLFTPAPVHPPMKCKTNIACMSDQIKMKNEQFTTKPIHKNHGKYKREDISSSILMCSHGIQLATNHCTFSCLFMLLMFLSVSFCLWFSRISIIHDSHKIPAFLRAHEARSINVKYYLFYLPVLKERKKLA